jgi:hypothetical protein
MMSKVAKKARKARDPNAPKIERKPINESVFVKAYVGVHKSGGNLMDVSKELGCSYAGARVKMEKLLEAGVQLPELHGGRKAKTFDVDALNAEIKANLG